MTVRAAAFLVVMLLAPTAGAAPRNIVIFVADGLRPVSLNPTDAPTLVRLQREGVFFANSHALFPTFTTANASAIATGHQLGDTGDFGNVIYPGHRAFDQGTWTPFIEDDQVLADLDAHHDGNFLGEISLLALARGHGFSTAAIGKVGPTLIQDITQGNRTKGAAPVPATIIIDDKTGTPAGLPLDPAIAAALKSALGRDTTPDRSNGKPKTPEDNGFAGNSHTPGTRAANVRQQQFLAGAITQVILPAFKKRGKPFVLLFWSRDPDATQHNQGDSLNDLAIGINGPTSKAAVHNADDSLRQILAYIEGDPALAATTDVLVTSDHGFSTLSRREIDAAGHPSRSGAAKRSAPDLTAGELPPGFVAIDLAAHLGLPLYDPDRNNARVGADEHPAAGNGLIGATPSEPKVIVAANGGSDLVYVPGGDAARIADLAAFLMGQDYVDGVFADAATGTVPGALSLRDINLDGSARTPKPSLVVALKSFSRDPRDPLRTQIDVSDSTLQEGQGMHGSFGRADTMNTMIAFGPDFKHGFVDRAPASNADLPITAARLLGLKLPSRGKLAGRVLSEALAGGPASVSSACAAVTSPPTQDGLRTVLHAQSAAGVRYLDAAQKATGAVSWGTWVADLPCGPPR
jgi:hypothetical protein